MADANSVSKIPNLNLRLGERRKRINLESVATPPVSVHVHPNHFPDDNKHCRLCT